jgi:hypothetical protein
MHARLHLLVSQSRSRASIRQRCSVTGSTLSRRRQRKCSSLSLPSASSHSFRFSRRRGRPTSTSNFHTTIKSDQSSLVSSSALLPNDDDDDEQEYVHHDSTWYRNDIFRTHPLPGDTFFTKASSNSSVNDDSNNSNNLTTNDDSLDQELEIDSVGDRSYDDYDDPDNTYEHDDDDDDEVLDYSDDLEDLEEESHGTFPTSPAGTFFTPPTISAPTTSFPSNLSSHADASVISIMEMLRNFDPDNPPTSGDAEELQLWLECFAQREAVVRHQQLMEKARDRKAFDAMSLMQRHIVQWFQAMRDAIETRQKEYISNTDKRRASTSYGPFLCSLHPEKMAVIVAQEAIIQSLICCGNDGTHGLTLVRMARAIGKAIETEVVSQRRIKERYRDAYSSTLEKVDTNIPSVEEGGVSAIDSVTDNLSSTGPLDDKEDILMDRWAFSASHLKLFWDDLKKIGMGKNKRSVQYAMSRAKQAMSSKETWTDNDLTHVGAALLSILMENAKVYDYGKEEPAFQVEKRWTHHRNREKSISYITIHDRLHKIFIEDECMSWAANTTRHLPMVVPPSKWRGPNKGAYRWLEVDLMRTHGSNVQRDALRQADLSIVCDGLDILGKTAWRINKEILEAGQRCWRDNISIGDIPSQTDFEVPPEPIRPSFASEVIYDKEDVNYQSRRAAMNAYRESTTKRQRIIQKNMVSNNQLRRQ